MEKPGVAVLEMAPIAGVEKDLARLVNEILLARVGMSGVFSSVIGSRDIQEMISLEQQKSILGCEEESCLAQLGGALGVPLMIAPTLGRLGDNYLITLKVTDVDQAKVLVRQILLVPDEPALTQGMEWVVKAALASYQGRPVPPEPTFERRRPVGWQAPTWFRPAGMGLVAVGLVATVSSYVHYQGGAAIYDQSSHLATPYQDYVDQTAAANQWLGAGLGSIITGTLLWITAP